MGAICLFFTFMGIRVKLCAENEKGREFWGDVGGTTENNVKLDLQETEFEVVKLI
jgi:hypothetical protein